VLLFRSPATVVCVTLGVFSLGVGSVGCSTPNALRPPRLDWPHKGVDDYAGGVKVGKVAIIAPAATKESEAKALRAALVSHLEESFPQSDPKLAPAKVDLVYRAQHSVHRTYLLDMIAIGYLGLFPLTPQWGHTNATIALNVEVPPQLRLGKGRFALYHYSTRRYHNTYFSWYTSDAVERAYERVHREVFEGTVGRLGATLGGQPSRLAPVFDFDHLPVRKGMRFDFDAKGELVKQRLLDPFRWRVIHNESLYDQGTAKTAPGFWHTYFSALSGIEGGYFQGWARVSSEARNTKTGERFTIASGKATSKGYKFNLFNPPTVSRFFIYPTVGFFSLDIDIEDMAGDIPLGQVAGAKDMPAVGSDPNTGEPIDLGAANVYSLRLRSGHIGQRAGGTMVYGTPNAQLFFTFEGGVNLLEWRYTEATLGGYNESKHHAAVFASFAARLLVGLAYRPWHVAGRCEFNVEAYRSFDFPRPLPFDAPPTYNNVLQTYERRPIAVESASAQTLNAYCGVSFAY